MNFLGFFGFLHSFIQNTPSKTPEIPLDNVSKVLLKAKELIEIGGWRQYTFEIGPNDSMCVETAILTASYAIVYAIERECGPTNNPWLGSSLVNEAKAQLRRTVTGIEEPYQWNDKPWRTKRGVLKGLEKAALARVPA